MKILFAFLTAIPVGMGLGGGGLLTVALTLTGEGQLLAQGYNLFCFFAAGGSAALTRLRELRGKWKVIGQLAAGAFFAAIPAALLARSIPGELLRRLFGGYMAAVGGYSLWKALRGRKKNKKST